MFVYENGKIVFKNSNLSQKYDIAPDGSLKATMAFVLPTEDILKIVKGELLAYVSSESLDKILNSLAEQVSNIVSSIDTTQVSIEEVQKKLLNNIEVLKISLEERIKAEVASSDLIVANIKKAIDSFSASLVDIYSILRVNENRLKEVTSQLSKKASLAELEVVARSIVDPIPMEVVLGNISEGSIFKANVERKDNKFILNFVYPRQEISAKGGLSKAAVLRLIAENSSSGGGIADAPADGNQYGRQNNSWTIITSGPGGGVTSGEVAGLTGQLTLLATTNSLTANLQSQINSNLTTVNSITGNFVRLIGNQNISGIKTFNDDVVISGNLSVAGGSYVVLSEHVSARDAILILNSGETGAGVTNLSAGISIDRGTQPNYNFIFDEVSDTFKIGEISSLQPVATRGENPVNGEVAIWSSGENKFNTTNNFVNVSGAQDIIGKKTVNISGDFAFSLHSENIDSYSELGFSFGASRQKEFGIYTSATSAAGAATWTKGNYISFYGYDKQQDLMTIDSSGTVYIPPTGLLKSECTLTAQCPRSGIYIFDDYIQYLGTTFIGIAGGGSHIIPIKSPANDWFGTLELGTGTTATGKAAIASGGPNIYLGLGNLEYGARVLMPVVSVSGVQQFKIWAGLNDNGGGDGQNMVGFTYTDVTSGGNFVATCKLGASRSDADTGVAVVANSGYCLRFNHIPGLGQVNYYINGVQVATIQDNIPTGYMFPQVMILKQAGTTNRNILLDYQRVIYPFDINFNGRYL